MRIDISVQISNLEQQLSDDWVETFISFAVIAALVLFVLIYMLCNDSNIKVVPYNLELDKELINYKKVGKWDGQFKYYNEWEEYIRKKYMDPLRRNGEGRTIENFIHYLTRRQRQNTDEREALQMLVFPIFIGMLASFITIDETSLYKWITFIALAIVLIAFYIKIIPDYDVKAYFYKDLIAIAQECIEEDNFDEGQDKYYQVLIRSRGKGK